MINIPYFSAVALVVWDGFRKVFLCCLLVDWASCHALCLGLWIAVAYVGIDKTTPMSISRHAAQSQAVTITNVVDLAQDGVGLELDLPNCCGRSFTVCGLILIWVNLRKCLPYHHRSRSLVGLILVICCFYCVWVDNFVVGGTDNSYHMIQMVRVVVLQRESHHSLIRQTAFSELYFFNS